MNIPHSVFLYNLYLIIRQSIQLIHKIINLLVGSVDLALEDGFFVGGFGCG
jgi:hypothetical protein